MTIIKKKKPKLLIVSGTYPKMMCGVAKHVDIIAKGAAQLGIYDVHVLTSNANEIDTAIAKTYQVHPIVVSWHLQHAFSITAKILKLKPDVVHIQNPTAKYCRFGALTISAIALTLKTIAPDIQLVVMQHDIAVGKRWFRFRYQPLLMCADSIVVSNIRDYQAVCDQYINPEKIYISPVASHMTPKLNRLESRETAREKLNIPHDTVVLIYFGFIHPGRHLDLIIRAIPHLSILDKPIKFIAMGSDANDAKGTTEALKSLASVLHLEKNVSFSGYATEDQIFTTLAAADVFVSLPQRGADMRNTTIHTPLLAGLPVVTLQNKDYYKDNILEQLGCITIDRLNELDVANAIIKALNLKQNDTYLSQRRQKLLPKNLWQQHIKINHDAYAVTAISTPGKCSLSNT